MTNGLWHLQYWNPLSLQTQVWCVCVCTLWLQSVRTHSSQNELFTHLSLFCSLLCQRLVEKFGAEEMQKKSEHPLVIRCHDEMALRLRDINASRFLFFFTVVYNWLFFIVYVEFSHVPFLSSIVFLILAPFWPIFSFFLKCVYMLFICVCTCVSLRRFRVLIQPRWSCRWWGGLQCGSWSTL